MYLYERRTKHSGIARFAHANGDKSVSSSIPHIISPPMHIVDDSFACLPLLLQSFRLDLYFSLFRVFFVWREIVSGGCTLFLLSRPLLRSQPLPHLSADNPLPRKLTASRLCDIQVPQEAPSNLLCLSWGDSEGDRSYNRISWQRN